MKLVATYEVNESALTNYARILEITRERAAANYLTHHLPAGSPFTLVTVTPETTDEPA